jgi:hypothetical protein
MAKSKSNRRKRSRGKKLKHEPEPMEDDDEEIEDEIKSRKRSQAAIKEEISRKKLDKIVILVAIIVIASTISVYFYNSDYWPFDNDGADDGSDEVIYGNYSAYDKNSWHIVDIGGHTNFLIIVDNTGTQTDTYKLTHENKDSRIKITFDDNNFKLNTVKTKLVIAELTTTITSEYRLPAPIKINLVSDNTKSILDTVTIDITVKDLSDGIKVVNGDKVSAFYTGAFGENGSLFDFSLRDPENKDPLFISLAEDVQTDLFESRQYVPVIPGFKNGIIGMVPEETQVIVVPPEQGYPMGHELGGSTLIFEVYLISNDRNL